MEMETVNVCRINALVSCVHMMPAENWCVKESNTIEDLLSVLSRLTSCDITSCFGFVLMF